MIKRASILLLLVQLAVMAMPASIVASSSVNTSTSAVASSEDGEELDALHHSANAYYLDFVPFKRVQLPRIFVVRHEDGSYGLDLFGSTASAILNGHYVSEVESHGAEDEGHEEAADDHAEANVEEGGISLEQLEGHLVPPNHGHVVLDLSISRHLFFAWISMTLILLLMTRLAGMYKRGVGRDTAPKGLFQNLFETLIMFVRDDIARPNLGDKTDKYLPYLLTAFFFILVSNLLGLVPFGATATSNLMVTVVLASFTFVITQLGGTKDYWMHIFWPPGIPTFVKPILMPVEVLGILTKPIALAIRLFANMTAGHLVILSLIGLIFSFANIFGPGAGFGVAPVSIAFALFIYFLELLVSFIQAYVFTMLSALFIGMAIEEHHHHDEAHADHTADAGASHGTSGEAQPAIA